MFQLRRCFYQHDCWDSFLIEFQLNKINVIILDQYKYLVYWMDVRIDFLGFHPEVLDNLFCLSKDETSILLAVEIQRKNSLSIFAYSLSLKTGKIIAEKFHFPSDMALNALP